MKALLIGLLLLSMAGGFFLYGIASHDAQFKAAAILPDGTEVPLHSLVQPTDFKSIKVTGWAYAEFEGDADLPVEVYYQLVGDNAVQGGWKKAVELELPKDGSRVDFNFTVSKEEVASFLSDVNLSEMMVSVWVVVVPKGLDPTEGPAVTAAEFKAIDMAVWVNEQATEEYKESTQNPTAVADNYVKKYALLYTAGNQTAAQKIYEAWASGQAQTLDMRSAGGNCDFVKVDPNMKPPIMCMDPYKAGYRKRAIRIVRKDFSLPAGEWQLVGIEDRGGVKCYTWRKVHGFSEKTFCEDRYHKLPQEAKGTLLKRQKGGFTVKGRVIATKYTYKTRDGTYTDEDVYGSEEQGHDVVASTGISSQYERRYNSGMLYRYRAMSFMLKDLVAGIDVPVDWPLLILASLLLLGGVVIVGREIRL